MFDRSFLDPACAARGARRLGRRGRWRREPLGPRGLPYRGATGKTEAVMRLSRYFLPVLKETPPRAADRQHRLMLRAGMIRRPRPASIPGCRWAPAC